MGTHKIYSGIQGIRDNISGSLYGDCHELLAALLPMCLPNPLAIVKLYDCGKERYNTFSVNC